MIGRGFCRDQVGQKQTHRIIVLRTIGSGSQASLCPQRNVRSESQGWAKAKFHVVER